MTSVYSHCGSMLEHISTVIVSEGQTPPWYRQWRLEPQLLREIRSITARSSTMLAYSLARLQRTSSIPSLSCLATKKGKSGLADSLSNVPLKGIRGSLSAKGMRSVSSVWQKQQKTSSHDLGSYLY